MIKEEHFAILKKMNSIVSSLVVKLHNKKVEYLSNLINDFLNKKGKIMDLGCGSGEISKKLLDDGYDVTSVDVVNKVKVGGVNVIVYDGKKLPFGDKEFDQVLIITVLHHVSEVESLLREVARVSKEMIIVEDVYENWWDRLCIWFWDSLLNLEIFGHPHNNKDDQGWKALFKKLGFSLKQEKSGSIRELIYTFKQKAYWISV